MLSFHECTALELSCEGPNAAGDEWHRRRTRATQPSPRPFKWERAAQPGKGFSFALLVFSRGSFVAWETIPEPSEITSGDPEMTSGTPKTISGTSETTSGHPTMTCGQPRLVSGHPTMTSGCPNVASGHPEAACGYPEMISEVSIFWRQACENEGFIAA